MNIFTYQQPFVLHFRYRCQVGDNNNRRHSPISLDSTWDTKFFLDCNFAWYLAVVEVNTALASGHFQNGVNVMPTLAFGRAVSNTAHEKCYWNRSW